MDVESLAVSLLGMLAKSERRRIVGLRSPKNRDTGSRKKKVAFISKQAGASEVAAKACCCT